MFTWGFYWKNKYGVTMVVLKEKKWKNEWLVELIVNEIILKISYNSIEITSKFKHIVSVEFAEKFRGLYYKLDFAGLFWFVLKCNRSYI